MLTLVRCFCDDGCCERLHVAAYALHGTTYGREQSGKAPPKPIRRRFVPVVFQRLIVVCIFSAVRINPLLNRWLRFGCVLGNLRTKQGFVEFIRVKHSHMRYVSAVGL